MEKHQGTKAKKIHKIKNSFKTKWKKKQISY